MVNASIYNDEYTNAVPQHNYSLNVRLANSSSVSLQEEEPLVGSSGNQSYAGLARENSSRQFAEGRGNVKSVNTSIEFRGTQSALGDYGRPRIKIRPDRFSNHEEAARPMWLTSTKQAKGGSSVEKNFGFAKKDQIALKHG